MTRLRTSLARVLGTPKADVPVPEAILEAIRERAWLPEQIEGVESRYALENHPPPPEGVEPWMDQKPSIRRAACTRFNTLGCTSRIAA